MAIIDGTAGNDVYNGTSSADTINAGDGNDRVRAGAGNDLVDGGAGSDALFGGADNDTLNGGEGDDFLDGESGVDRMVGGEGNDTYVVDDFNDVVIETDGTGGGIDTLRGTITLVANKYAGIEKFELIGSDEIDFVGDARDNTVKGNGSANLIGGGAGNDTIYAGGGDDLVFGGTGNDLLNGGDGIDTVSYKDAEAGVTVNLSLTRGQNVGGGMGVDNLAGFENLEGSQFDDVLTGDSGANKVVGLGGNDLIRGGAGNDDLTGGSGNDTFRFESAAANGFDFIRGFQVGTDKLQFDDADGYSSAATLTVNTVESQGGAAAGSGSQFIFNTQSGLLYYDADGDGANSAVLLASLANNPPVTTLTLADFAFV